MKIYEKKFLARKITDSVSTTRLPKGLKIVKTDAQMEKIEQFREKIFATDYPELGSFHNDLHDPFSIVMYTDNQQGEITSTARLIFDSPVGFPADEYAGDKLNFYRQNGKKMVEAGRLAISEQAGKEGSIAAYYKAFYELSAENKIDSVIVVINQNHVKFYRNRLGAKMLMDGLKNIAGSQFDYACMEWPLENTGTKFFQWAGIGKNKQANTLQNIPDKAPYAMSTWNKYSQMFASIYTNYQRKVYQEASNYLFGHVLDLGCGPARLAPILVDNKSVSAYTGIEYASEMHEIAEFTMQKLAKPSFTVLHQGVEETKGEFESAVSLLSYYAFSNPISTLKHIFSILKAGACFVIANPNEKLNEPKLLDEVEKEMMWHPDYDAFKKYNLELANNPQAGFISMDQLIKQLMLVGFRVVTCHQNHYEGGLNFIVCEKPLKIS